MGFKTRSSGRQAGSSVIELAHSRLVAAEGKDRTILFINFVLGASSTDWWTLVLMKAYTLEDQWCEKEPGD